MRYFDKIVTTAAAASLALALSGCGTANSGDANSSIAAADNSAMANSTAPFQQGVEAGFRKQFVAAFNQSCVKSATQAGLPQAKAGVICSCAANRLVAKYQVRELMALTPDKVTPVVKQCTVSPKTTTV